MEESNIHLNVPQAEDESVAWIYHKDREVERAFSKEDSNHELHDNIVYEYFEKKKIRMLFDFMVQHLMIYEPDNPIEYLKDLADKLLMWRSGTVATAPQLFEVRHVEAIYTALDPADLGVISLEQYHNGFRTLMLHNYTLYPKLNEEGFVEKQVFIQNSLSALDRRLMAIVKPTYTTLCELTILPDPSYDILFQDHPSEEEPWRISKDQVATIEEKESSISCPSSVSCVQLVPSNYREPSIEEDRLSIISAISTMSDDAISVLDLEPYDFLIKTSFVEGYLEFGQRKGTVPGSKITMIGGKVGDNVKDILAEDLAISSVSTFSGSRN